MSDTPEQQARREIDCLLIVAGPEAAFAEFAQVAADLKVK